MRKTQKKSSRTITCQIGQKLVNVEVTPVIQKPVYFSIDELKTMTTKVKQEPIRVKVQTREVKQEQVRINIDDLHA